METCAGVDWVAFHEDAAYRVEWSFFRFFTSRVKELDHGAVQKPLEKILAPDVRRRSGSVGPQHEVKPVMGVFDKANHLVIEQVQTLTKINDGSNHSRR